MKKKIFLHYDTTYNCSNYYLSILSMKNFELENDPAYAIAFVIHQHRSKSSHLKFFNYITKIFDFNQFTDIITDREAGIISSIKECLKVKQLTANLIFCKIHIQRDLNYWIKENLKKIEKKIEKEEENDDDKKKDDNFMFKEVNNLKLNLDDLTIDDLTDLKYKFLNFRNQSNKLIDVESKIELLRIFEDQSPDWPDICSNYFQNHILCALISNLERSVGSEEKILIDKFENNLSESLNHSLKHFLNHQCLVLDQLVLGLFNFTCKEIGEFNRGYSELGDFYIKENHKENDLHVADFNYFDFKSNLVLNKQEFKLSTEINKIPSISRVKLAELIIEKNLISFCNELSC